VQRNRAKKFGGPGKGRPKTDIHLSNSACGHDRIEKNYIFAKTIIKFFVLFTLIL
jgi:hypothetical protein